MAQKIFELDNVSLYTSWTYTKDTEDDAGVRYDRTSFSGADSDDRTVTISGIDISTITSITLTWTVDATLDGSVSKPTATGIGYGSAKVYPGAQSSSGSVRASAGTLTGLKSYLDDDNTVTCRFYYNPSSLPLAVYDDTSYGVGSCSGTVSFKNINLIVTYGDTSEPVDDEGYGLWVGVGDKARHVKNMYVGIDGVARRVKAAWIGVNNLARLFYTAATRLAATASRYKNSSGTTSTGTTLNVYEIIDDGSGKGKGYAGIQFGGSSEFSKCTKVTLNLHIISGGSASTKIYIYLRSGGDSWFSNYDTSIGSSYRVTYSDTTTGLHSYDITEDLKNLYSSDSSIKTDGVKVYLRCAAGNTIKIAGHANTSYQTPYIELVTQ